MSSARHFALAIRGTRQTASACTRGPAPAENRGAHADQREKWETSPSRQKKGGVWGKVRRSRPHCGWWSNRKRTPPKLRGTMANLTTFQTDIRPLFTERDIQAMRKAFNLASYDDVKAHAAVIYDRIRGIGGAVMPPPPPRGEGPWPQSQIELFGKWMADGYQP